MENYEHNPIEHSRKKCHLSYETTHDFVVVAFDEEKRETCSNWFSHIFWNELPNPKYLKEHFEVDNRTVAEFFYYSTDDADIKLYLKMRWNL